MSHRPAPRRFRHVTYANVMSTIAAAAVLTTGTAWAAATIGSGDIRNNAVKGRHVAPNAITGSDVKARSLRGSDIGLGSIAENNLSTSAREALGGTYGYALRSTLDSPWQTNMVDTKAIRINLSCFGGYTTQPEIAPHFGLSIGSEGNQRAWMTVRYDGDDAPAGNVRKQVAAPDYFSAFADRTGTGSGSMLAGIGNRVMYQGTFSYTMDDAANTCDAEWAVSKVGEL